MSIYPASIDDNDPQVLYSSGWVLVTSDPPWTGTIHSTSQTGALASVRFTGSRVAVICTIPTGDGHMMSMASFSIDKGPAVQVAVVTIPPVQYQYEFWNSDPLPMGSHLLVINNTGNENYFRLDRIDYDPTNSNAPTSSTSLPPAATSAAAVPNAAPVPSSATTVTVRSSSSASSDGLLGSKSGVSLASSVSGVSSSMASTLFSTHNDPTPTPANNSATESHGSSNFSTIEIVAGVLGGLLFLVLIIALVIFCRRRKKRSIYSQALETPHDPLEPSNPTIPRPFILNTYADSPSTMLPSDALVLLDRKQTSTALKDSSMDDTLSTSAYSISSLPLVTYCDSDPLPATTQQAPLVLHVGRHQMPPEKRQGIANRTIGRSSNTASDIAVLDSPPAYSGFS